MTTKPLDKMSKPELVKAALASKKRIVSLERRLAGVEAELLALNSKPYDVVHVTQGPDTVSDLVPPVFPWNDKSEDK